MSSMALYRDVHSRRAPASRSNGAPSRERQGILQRMSSAIDAWLRGRAEREAGIFIAKHGGRLTDDIERQLAEHFNGRGFPPYAPPRSFRPFA